MKLKLFFTFLLTSFAINAQIFVDKDATGSNDGSSWANAYTDLQMALNNDALGSNIWIAEGEYSPGSSRNDSFILDKSGITLYGGFNGSETQLNQRDVHQYETILTGDVNNDDSGVAYFGVNRFDNNYNVVKVNSNSCAIDGITITSGQADDSSANLTNQGSAILISRDNFTLKNAKINKNVVTGAGVVRMLDRQGYLNIENCVFRGNLGNNAVNIYTRALGGTLEVNITNSLFVSNTLEAATGNGDSGLLWFRQDINFAQNVTIVNCTFANNSNITKTGGSSVVVANKGGNGSVRIKTFNSIFWDNKNAANSAMRAIGNDHSSLQNANLYQIESSISEDGLSNLTHNNTSIININNSNADPLFKNSKDFTLQANSIAINVGDNSKIPTGVTLDLLGNKRLQADKVDLGCYESSSTTRNTPFNITYVDKNATGNNDGSSWANAITDLQTALNNTDQTKEIWVASGVYKPTTGGGGRFNKFTINKDYTTIYGGFAGTEKSPLDRDLNNNPTTISGDVNDDDTGNDFSGVNRSDNLYQLFVIETYNVSIDGFTLTSGTADVNSTSGINPRGEGAAITVIPRNFSIPIDLVVRNSIIENNLCIRGGVIRVIDKLGNITLENTIFRNNLATFSTLLYTRAYIATNGRLNTAITNCLIESNTVAKTSGVATGGIMYFRGAQISKQFVTITNSTFVDNDNASSGNTNATLISAQSGVDVKVFNSIFWNNKNANNQTLKTVGNDISSGTGTFSASNSLSDDTSFDLTASSGNLDLDPQFTSATDFTLQATSPAINAGDNSKVPSNIHVDLAGQTRVFGSAIDMGAYESKVMGTVKRTLTITAVNGTVTTSPNPVNGTYDDGTVVTLTATPDTNFAFVDWTGDVSGTNATITITMDADKNVSANFNSTLSIVEAEIESVDFNVFPNPVNDILNISTDFEIKHIIIYNIVGKKIVRVQHKNIDVSKLESGVYFLRLETDSGKILSKKFIKK